MDMRPHWYCFHCDKTVIAQNLYLIRVCPLCGHEQSRQELLWLLDREHERLTAEQWEQWRVEQHVRPKRSMIRQAGQFLHDLGKR